MYETFVFNYHFIQLTHTRYCAFHCLMCVSVSHVRLFLLWLSPIYWIEWNEAEQTNDKNGSEHRIDPIRGQPKCKMFILKFIHYFSSSFFFSLDSSEASSLLRASRRKKNILIYIKCKHHFDVIEYAVRQKNFTFSVPGSGRAMIFPSFFFLFIVQNSKAYKCEAKHTV